MQETLSYKLCLSVKTKFNGSLRFLCVCFLPLSWTEFDFTKQNTSKWTVAEAVTPNTRVQNFEFPSVEG